MATPESWRKVPTQDKLNIFVSSRLEECKDERTVARNSIMAINHNPVLFEYIGARAITARDLYLSRLRDSQIMVAIHRLGYGYIDTAGGMEISGLEDEFLYAQKNGIPTLLYVYGDDTGRDHRLCELIASAQSKLKICFYRDTNELADRIRDDVTAEITRSFVRPDISRGVLEETSNELLNRTVRRQGELIERTEVLNNLALLAREAEVICIYGRVGIGKTTLAAQFARKFGASYVRVTGLAPRDLFSVCAEAIENNQTSVPAFSTLSGARLGFSSVWAGVNQVTLVIDECEFIDELMLAIEHGGGVSSDKRILFTSRQPHETYSGLEVPPLTEPEAQQLLSAKGLRLLVAEQEGAPTPLQIQALIVNAENTGKPANSNAREIQSYLALCPTPVNADELLALLGDDALTIEGLYRDLRTLGRLVDDSPSGFRLMHTSTAQSYIDSLKQTPQRLRFYVNRLVQMFENRSDARLAYEVVSLLDDGSEERFAFAAMRQSIQLGDALRGRAIAEKLLTAALRFERRGDAFDLMLSLIYPLELMGDISRASELLKAAEQYAEDLGEEAAARVAEVRLGSQARRTLSEKDVKGLEEVRDQYAMLGRTWDQARLNLELSALYIASKNYEQAVKVLRPSLQAFKDAGDDYGVDLAERNLAATLAALPANDAEVDEILKRVSERSSQSVDPRRQRAWYCNILTRRYRMAGRLDEAEAVAKEVIELSAALGDKSLTALTHINLANVYRDMKAVAEALAAYDEAGRLARHCGRRDIEADSSRLRAGILNDIPESAAVIPDRHQQAKLLAQHAIGLLAGTIYRDSLAHSYVELADSEKELGNLQAAAYAYFRAAEQFRLAPDDEDFENALALGAEYALDTDPRFYLAEIASSFSAPLDAEDSLGDQFIKLVSPIIEKAPRERLVRLLGRHVQKVRSELPPLLRPVLLEAITDAVEGLSRQRSPKPEPWRQLYAGFVAPFLSQDNQKSYVHRRLASAICSTVSGLDVRYLESGDQVWTVVLEFERPTVLTILPIDDTAASAVAAQSLAFFLKAFDDEIREIVGKTDVVELFIQVVSFDDVPSDIREMAVRMFEIDQLLEDQSVAVTRTEDFGGSTPTFVFLHADFLERARAGEGINGSLQMLFALTMIELVFQLLRGEVGHEQIRPKVVSLVRRTLS